MKFTFESQGTNTYLVYQIVEGDQIDQLTLNMMTNNRISGFAPVSYTQKDMNKFLKYNISAKISYADFLSRVVTKKSLTTSFAGILAAFAEAEAYMIDTESIFLHRESIFIDVSAFETAVVCLPLKGFRGKPGGIGSFFKEIMFNAQFDQHENNDYVGKIVNYLNGSAPFSAVEFAALIRRLSGEPNVKDLANAGGNAMIGKAVAPLQPAPVSAQRPGSAPQPQAAAQPQAVPMPAAPSGSPAATQTQEKQMSFAYLMAHYSKENKAIYDNQQKQKKQGGAAAQQQQPPVPNQQLAAPAGSVTAPSGNAAKPMSLSYLMAHYSKENKAIYDSQQKQKKQGGAPSGNAVSQPQSQFGFAVPGQKETAGAGYVPMQAPAAIPVAAQKQQVSPPPAPAIPQPVQAPAGAASYIPPQSPAMPQQMVQQSAAPANFGGTTILGGAELGTTILSGMPDAPQGKGAYLIRSKTGERIEIKGDLFRIGKERNFVDYCISDNSVISRSHAAIRMREGVYFLVDTNSTNHSFVDGAMLSPNVEMRLENGAKIRLGNEELVFYLY